LIFEAGIWIAAFQTLNSKLKLHMPKLIIDNRHIEVPTETRVIEAAERLGIMIPRFCYLKALGAVGACRMCAVWFEDGPVKGLQMSCMVTAADGMVVSTAHPEALAFRRSIIEWLMINHPHDCPVCDEGGHCLLQDETISGGHSRRRFTGRKRTYHDQDLGPLVQHEMNRCIQCYRCARFYQEYAGYRDLGTMGIASRVYFGRLESGVLKSPFAGNLIDICPTGVYTDKPSRFQARRWDLQRAPSLCLHCSLGCNTTAGAHYGAVIRQEARENNRVNGFFICDRGRYGFAYANLVDRPRQTRVDGRDVGWREAVQEAAKRLSRITLTAGHPSVAVLGSARSSLETLVIERYLCRHVQWRLPLFFVSDAEAEASAAVASGLDSRLAAGLPDLEQADFLVAVGADPLRESPMLALAMRQAARQGAKIMVLDPRPVALPFAFEHLPVGIDELAPAFALLARSAIDASEAQRLAPEEQSFFDALPDTVRDKGLQEKIAAAGRMLAASHRPALICGTALDVPALPDLAADLARLLRGAIPGCRLLYTLPGANAFGAGLLRGGNRSFASLLEDIENGRVRALLLVENDPFFRFPQYERLTKALEKLDLLVVLDYLSGPAGQLAHILLPTATIFEKGGSFVNSSGLLQYASPVHAGGVPLVQRSGGGHPPRLYDRSKEPELCPSAYEALLELACKLGVRTATAEVSPWSLLPEEYPEQAEILQHSYPSDGLQLLPPVSGAPSFQSLPLPQTAERPEDGLRLVLTEATFGTEELSSHAEPLRTLAGPPRAYLQARDAASLDLHDDDLIAVEVNGEKVELQLRVADAVAAGHLVVPLHFALRQRELRWPAIMPRAGLKKLMKAEER